MTYLRTNIMDATEGQGLKVLVHGPPGSGKTTLCATTGVLDKTLIISCEASLQHLRKLHQEHPQAGIDQIDVWIPRTVIEFAQMLADLQKGDHGYEWVCIDSVTEIAEIIVAEAKARLADGRAVYGDLYERMLELLKGFRDLPLHVYMICQQYRDKEPLTGKLLYRPTMPGNKLDQRIPYLFTEVFALRVEFDADGPYRFLQCHPDGVHDVKDNAGRMDAQEPANLQHLLSKFMGVGQ